jgi:hypothetical protein
MNNVGGPCNPGTRYVPFGPSPIALACLELTTYIERLHLLTILSTLAPLPYAIKECVSPRGVDAC